VRVEFTAWPKVLEQYYHKVGYWRGESLSVLVEQYATSDDIALIGQSEQISYRELDRRSTRLAHYLLSNGVCKGDTAIVQLPNVPEFYVVFFALIKAGIVAVNANFSHQKLEILAYARQLKPTLMIGSAKHELFDNPEFYQQIRNESSDLVCLLLAKDEFGSSDSRRDFSDDLTSAIGSKLQKYSEPLPMNDANEVAFFQLSGGSTGTPKLIPRTHNDYLYSVRRSAEICRLSSQTVYLCALPAGHNFPLSSPGALGIFACGGCVVLASNPEPTRCFDLIDQHKVTMTSLVPSAVNLWLDLAVEHQQKISSLQLLQVGGANFSPALAQRIPSELDCQLQQVFGMAEGLVNYTRLDDDPTIIFGTQGRPMCPDDEIRIVDHNGYEVGLGEAGELATRGPYTFRGYYQSPEHNKRVFDDQGFYYSGDIVIQDIDDNLRVVGRVKDQINRGGEKIAAEEIENLLLAHPHITDAALIAVPDITLGEKSCACLVTNTAELKPREIRKFLRLQGIADYKLPDHFHFVQSLPLTAIGKINKQRLREQLNDYFVTGVTTP